MSTEPKHPEKLFVDVKTYIEDGAVGVMAYRPGKEPKGTVPYVPEALLREARAKDMEELARFADKYWGDSVRDHLRRLAKEARSGAKEGA